MLAALAEIGATSGLAAPARAAASLPDPVVVESDDGEVQWPEDAPIDTSPEGQARARARFLSVSGG
jgi:hypothetical protein